MKRRLTHRLTYITHYKDDYFDENQIWKINFRQFSKNIQNFWLKLPFLAPPKTLVRFSEWSDLTFSVFSRSGKTGPWTPKRFGRLRVNCRNREFGIFKSTYFHLGKTRQNRHEPIVFSGHQLELFVLRSIIQFNMSH